VTRLSAVVERRLDLGLGSHPRRLTTRARVLTMMCVCVFYDDAAEANYGN